MNLNRWGVILIRLLRRSCILLNPHHNDNVPSLSIHFASVSLHLKWFKRSMLKEKDSQCTARHSKDSLVSFPLLSYLRKFPSNRYNPPDRNLNSMILTFTRERRLDFLLIQHHYLCLDLDLCSYSNLSRTQEHQTSGFHLRWSQVESRFLSTLLPSFPLNQSCSHCPILPKYICKFPHLMDSFGPYLTSRHRNNSH